MDVILSLFSRTFSHPRGTYIYEYGISASCLHRVVVSPCKIEIWSQTRDCNIGVFGYNLSQKAL